MPRTASSLLRTYTSLSGFLRWPLGSNITSLTSRSGGRERIAEERLFNHRTKTSTPSGPSLRPRSRRHGRSRVSCKHRQPRQTDCLIPVRNCIGVKQSVCLGWLCLHDTLDLPCAQLCIFLQQMQILHKILERNIQILHEL